MLVKKELIREDGVFFQRLYSDKGMYIREKNTNYLYCEIVNRTVKELEYEETDQLIEEEDYEMSEQDF